MSKYYDQAKYNQLFSLGGQVSYYLGLYPKIMGSLFIWISKMAVSSSQKFSQRFLKEIYFSGVQAFF